MLSVEASLLLRASQAVRMGRSESVSGPFGEPVRPLAGPFESARPLAGLLMPTRPLAGPPDAGAGSGRAS